MWMEMKKKKDEQQERQKQEEAERKRRELLKRQEEEEALKKKLRSIPTSRDCTSTSMFYPQQIVRGLDGNVYRIVYPSSGTAASPTTSTAAVNKEPNDMLLGVHPAAHPFFGLFDDDHVMMDVSNSLPTSTSSRKSTMSKNPSLPKTRNHGDDNHDDEMSSTEEESVSTTNTTTSSSSDESDSEAPTRTMSRMNSAVVQPQEEKKKNDKPVFKNVTFNININHADDNIKMDDATVPMSNKTTAAASTVPRVVKSQTAATTTTTSTMPSSSTLTGDHLLRTTTSMKKALKPKSSFKQAKKKKERSARKKSSVLIGDVENASDSECEDVYGDYFHNRRPSTPGVWIEPVEGYGVRTLR
jgi:hypothetical protein